MTKIISISNIYPSNEFILLQHAFGSGTGDFVQLFEPTASIFEQEGKGHIVASFGEESGHVPYTTFMAKESYINKNEKKVEKFVRAIHKAQVWVEESDPAEIAEVVHPYFEDTDVETLAVVVERYKNQGSFAKEMKLTEEGWKNLQDIMEEAGELPEKVDYQKLVNTDIVDKVLKGE